MASVIDLDKLKNYTVALVDLENIRISFEQRYYGKNFLYSDLVHLIRLAEIEMKNTIDHIYIYATDPIDLIKHTYYKFRKKLNKPLVKDNFLSIDWDKLMLEVNKLPECKSSIDSVKVFLRTISFVQKDHDNTLLFEAKEKEAEACKRASKVKKKTFNNDDENIITNIDTNQYIVDIESDSSCEIDDFSSNSDSNNCIKVNNSNIAYSNKRKYNNRELESNFTLTGINNARKVYLKLYKNKLKNNHVTQRGVDVSMGVEIVKCCFHPSIKRICVFSADSDFNDVIADCKRVENVGGVMKFVIDVWVFGFSYSMISPIREYLIANNGRYEENNIKYICIYHAYPLLKIALGLSNNYIKRQKRHNLIEHDGYTLDTGYDDNTIINNLYLPKA